MWSSPRPLSPLEFGHYSALPVLSCSHQSGPPSGPRVLWQSRGPGQGQRQWASAWGPRILAPPPGALRAGQVDMGGDGGSGERKTLELRFTAQPMHLAPGEHLEAEPGVGVERARAAGLCIKRNAGIQPGEEPALCPADLPTNRMGRVGPTEVAEPSSTLARAS